jgi:hypothetical protein
MIKRVIDGIECVFYEQNLSNDNLVLMRCGSEQLTTKQTKYHINKVISVISYLIEGGSILDERLDKYSTALSVFNAIKAVLNLRKPNINPSIEAGKIAIDVIKEISLMEIKDPIPRAAIKSISIVAKFMLDMGGGDE